MARSSRLSALSDQETFALLAESMADGRNGNGSSGQVVNGYAATNARAAANAGQVSNGHHTANGRDRNGSTGHKPHREPFPWRVTRPDWRQIEPVSKNPPRPGDESPTRDDMPPVVPFRITSPGLESAIIGDRPHGPTGRKASSRHRFDWSTPILVDEQWEIVDMADTDPIHGTVTEVIDLSQFPPVVLGTDPDGVVAPVQREFASADSGMETPVTSKDRPDATNRVLPTIEECNDAESLPPLVFLNTRGDILPRIGETSNGWNDDTFDRGAAACDGGGPPVATTASASGVENMADPRGHIEAAADIGPAVDTPNRLDDPGLIGAGDTQILQPRFTSEASIHASTDSPAETSVASGDPDAFRAAMVSPNSSGVDADPRLEELEHIFDQYSGPVIAVIASIAEDRRAIDEALQSTFEAVWKTVDSFDPEQPRGPWMFTLARRQAAEQVDLVRRLERESKPGRYPVPSHRQDEAITVDKSWEAWEVRLAVDQLTQAEHDVLRLIHNEGLIHPEIAARLHTTVGAVKSHAYSGSHRLVELLDHVIRPDADDGLTVDQASALTWYLAGVADGSDLGTEERSAVKRVQAQLASATAWINPDPHGRERVISHARRMLDDPGPLASGEHHGLGNLGTDGSVAPAETARPEVTGRHQVAAEPDTSNSRPWLIVGLSAVGLIALVAAFALRSGPTEAEPEAVRRYQLQASGLDADASGFVEITAVSTGSRYELELGGLEAATDDFFYAAWLQSTAGGGVVPLGTFSRQAAGDSLMLSGPGWSDAYDLLVITRSETMTRASIDDPAVLTVSIE